MPAAGRERGAAGLKFGASSESVFLVGSLSLSLSLSGSLSPSLSLLGGSLSLSVGREQLLVGSLMGGATIANPPPFRS